MILPASDDAMDLIGGYAVAGARLNNLMHHVGSVRALEWARKRCNPGAALGTDGEALAAVDLAALSAAVLSGAYRPLPARYVDLDKIGGGTRRIVVPAARDKIVQTALARVVRAAWGRFDVAGVNVSFASSAAHRAAGWYHRKRCRWVYETDLAQCFDTIRRDRLLAALRRKVSDPRFVALVSTVMGRDVGIPQGYACAPALVDLYLHHAVDRWWREWSRSRVSSFAARYVDDAVFGFEHKRDLDAFALAFPERLRAWGLAPKEAKTVARRALGPLRFLGLDRGPRGNAPLRLRERVASAESPAALAGLWTYYRRSCSRRALRIVRSARRRAA